MRIVILNLIGEGSGWILVLNLGDWMANGQRERERVIVLIYEFGNVHSTVNIVESVGIGV